MKKITLLVLIACTFSFAQQTVNYTPGAAPISLSFVEAFEISNGTSAAAFGYNADFTQTFVGTDVTIIPNSEIWESNNGSNSNFNPFWFSAQGVPSKTLDVLTFNEVQWDGNGTPPDLLNQELTFSVDLSSYTLDPAYTLSITVTIFEGGFGNFRRESVVIPSSGSGTYSVTMPASSVSPNDRIWQYGFFLSGPMADPNDTTLGDATFAQFSLSTNDLEVTEFSIFPNPTNGDWNIKSNSEISKIALFDVLGKEVLTRTPSTNEVKINASTLPTGVYFVRIDGLNGTKTAKLVKN